MFIPSYEIPVPSAGIFDYPLVSRSINAHWAGMIDGQLSRLLSEDVWSGTDEQKAAAVQAIQQFLVSLSQESPPMSSNFINGFSVAVNDYAGSTNLVVGAGSARDCTNQHDLVIATASTVTKPALAAATWYKIIVAKNLISGAVSCAVKDATYTTVEGERFIGWIRTFANNAAWVQRMVTVGSGNLRTVYSQEAYVDSNTAQWLSSENPPAAYTDFSLASIVPDGTLSANLGFRGESPSTDIFLRYRASGVARAASPFVGFFAANKASQFIFADVAVRNRSITLLANVAASAGWLSSWLHSYTFEV